MYLESVVGAQREELRGLRVYYDNEVSELRKSLAASQADCADLRHELLLYRSLVNQKNAPVAFNSTFAPSSLDDGSPRLFFHSPPMSPPVLSVSSPFTRPRAPPPAHSLSLDEI